NKLECPPGSVPIKRASREDLIMAKSIKSLGLNYPTNSPYHGKNVDTRGHHSAVLEHTSGNFGARARLSVWNPSVEENQFSSGGMWIANGDVDELTSIQTGWIVHKNSGESRLYTYWTADGYQNTGCFNTLCEGFVHVSPKIALGLVLPHSVVNGSQFDVLLSLHLDRVSGHWWLMLEDKYIGYWPRTVIPVLGGGARFVSWGGQIYSPLNVLSPAMGSGNYPADAIGVNYGKTAYVRQIKVVPDYKDSAKFEDPQLEDIKTWADKPVCYKAQKFVNEVRGWGFQVYFGGPRGCTF
ncbi:uncharacterized protein LOC21407017, partial [Morus notabilis]|uniref:uncharacterized protein LOC21407017 n=1 Tax=Morus notabilis TaxID=981085 RepID=UPI000CED0E3B